MKTLVVWCVEGDTPNFFLVEDREVPDIWHNDFINCSDQTEEINDFFYDKNGKERYAKLTQIQTGTFDKIIITGQM